MYDRLYGSRSRCRRVAFGTAVVLAVIGAVGFGAYKVGVLDRGGLGVGLTDAAAPRLGEGEGHEEGGAEPSQPAQPPAACAGPLPERVRFDDPNIPTGDLGEWVEVQNDEGKVALRFKVELLDAKVSGVFRVGGRASPMVLAKFGITVENDSCETLAWNPRTPGFWVGTKKRIDKMPTYGWVRPDTDYSEILLVPYKGRFYKAEEENLKSIYLLIEHQFDGRWPQEFPEQVSAAETAYGEFLIEVEDVLGIGPSPPVGPEGDGNLPLVIGGYQSWARINLGSAASWYEKFIGDPRDPSTLPPHLRP